MAPTPLAAEALRVRSAGATRRVYLDNNVYAFLQEHDVAPGDARKFFDALGICVVGSQVNLLEAHQIEEPAVREGRFRLLGTCVSAFTDPEGYVWAQETLSQVTLWRPQWLRKRPATSRISVHLNRARRSWTAARSAPAQMPAWGADTTLLAEIRRAKMENQKKIREAMRGVTLQSELGARPLRIKTPTGEVTRPDTLKNHTRFYLMGMWAAGLFDTSNPMKDLRDYLGVYLLDGIESSDWTNFWLDDADLTLMPSSHVLGAADWLELRQRPGGGNSADAGHAVHLLDAEQFVTCDQGLFWILQQTVAELGLTCRPLLADRSVAPLDSLTDTLAPPALA